MSLVIGVISGQGAADQDPETGGKGALPQHEEGEGADDEAGGEDEEGHRGGGA